MFHFVTWFCELEQIFSLYQKNPREYIIEWRTNFCDFRKALLWAQYLNEGPKVIGRKILKLIIIPLGWEESSRYIILFLIVEK